jgi:hypothetical protein
MWLAGILKLPVPSGRFLNCEHDVLKNSSNTNNIDPFQHIILPLLQKYTVNKAEKALI